jgi:hypothetical protein
MKKTIFIINKKKIYVEMKQFTYLKEFIVRRKIEKREAIEYHATLEGLKFYGDYCGLTFDKTFYGPIEYWNIDQYNHQWNDALQYLENNDYSVFINRIIRKKRKHSFETITLIHLYKFKNYIGLREKDYYRKNDEGEEMVPFLNCKNITIENWKEKILPYKPEMHYPESHNDIRNFYFFIPTFDEQDKNCYRCCDEIIKHQPKEFLISSDEHIPNIKLGVYSKIYELPHEFICDGVLFLGGYIINIRSSITLSWDHKKYLDQWTHALNHLRNNNQTCFVLKIQNTSVSCFFEQTCRTINRVAYIWLLNAYKKNNKIYFQQSSISTAHNEEKFQYIFNTLGYFSEIKFEDFYKLIPPLNLTKKSEYIVIDDLIEY